MSTPPESFLPWYCEILPFGFSHVVEISAGYVTPVVGHRHHEQNVQHHPRQQKRHRVHQHVDQPPLKPVCVAHQLQNVVKVDLAAGRHACVGGPTLGAAGGRAVGRCRSQGGTLAVTCVGPAVDTYTGFTGLVSAAAGAVRSRHYARASLTGRGAADADRAAAAAIFQLGLCADGVLPSMNRQQVTAGSARPVPAPTRECVPVRPHSTRRWACVGHKTAPLSTPCSCLFARRLWAVAGTVRWLDRAQSATRA